MIKNIELFQGNLSLHFSSKCNSFSLTPFQTHNGHGQFVKCHKPIYLDLIRIQKEKKNCETNTDGIRQVRIDQIQKINNIHHFSVFSMTLTIEHFGIRCFCVHWHRIFLVHIDNGMVLQVLLILGLEKYGALLIIFVLW